MPVRVILLSGPQGSGKTSTARHLARELSLNNHPVVTMKFADPLYECHDAVREILYSYGVPVQQTIDGKFLQFLGLHGRDTIGEHIWRDILRTRIERALQLPDSIVIVDDLRFRNEAQVLPRDQVFLVRLNAEESVRRSRAEKWRTDTTHPSEVDLDSHTDWDMIFDTGIYSEVGKRAWEICQKIKYL